MNKQRLIDAEELVKEILSQTYIFDTEYLKGMMKEREIMLERIKDTPTIEAREQWISVKDRLPDKAGWYLVFRTKHTHAETAFFKGKTFPLDNHYGTITHWMPLSEPPKEENK